MCLHDRPNPKSFDGEVAVLPRTDYNPWSSSLDFPSSELAGMDTSLTGNSDEMISIPERNPTRFRYRNASASDFESSRWLHPNEKDDLGSGTTRNRV